ncbi:hypothetical protein [Pseudomonas guariconensis]|uniref:hypothetical protein n=1 Tax=Pseudomonas guariconensis TaxID=1288410 RepID=UPI0018A9B95B|nr:hypothetical protein [Pseudomonas guariconensis]MBF8753769.1 hypothetical protein [Pseudomonas guariconensis]
MKNSKKVVHELNSAVQKFNQTMRSVGSSRPDAQAAADCFNRLVAAISDIDQRLVDLEEAHESAQLKGKASSVPQ